MSTVKVLVPIQPMIDWWCNRHPNHEHLGCVCTVGGTCSSVECLARHVGVSHSTMHRRLRSRTLTVHEADEWAIAVGVHPMAIWTDWDRLRTCKGYWCEQQ